MDEEKETGEWRNRPRRPRLFSARLPLAPKFVDDSEEDIKENDDETVPAASCEEYWRLLSEDLHAFLVTPKTFPQILEWAREKRIDNNGRRLPLRFRTIMMLRQTLAWLSFKGLALGAAGLWRQTIPIPPSKFPLSSYPVDTTTHPYRFGSED